MKYTREANTRSNFSNPEWKLALNMKPDGIYVITFAPTTRECVKDTRSDLRSIEVA